MSLQKIIQYDVISRIRFSRFGRHKRGLCQLRIMNEELRIVWVLCTMILVVLIPILLQLALLCCCLLLLCTMLQHCFVCHVTMLPCYFVLT